MVPKVPVALFIHARPEHTVAVMRSIGRYRPEKLYVVADGPRLGRGSEWALCQEARRVATGVSWPCEVITKFRDTNAGAGVSVKEGLDWVFSLEDRAVILEDDTVPVASFYYFCETLLEKYQSDTRVGMISGSNVIGYRPPGPESYLFSSIPVTWGWATWARAWELMDFDMTWRQRGERATLSNISLNRRHRHYWRWVLSALDAKKVDTWDWQWFASLAIARALTVVASSNLVENIGFGPGATHATTTPKGLVLGARDINQKLRHPERVERELGFEAQMIRVFLPERRPERRALRGLRQWVRVGVLDRVFVFLSARGVKFSCVRKDR